MKEQDSSHGILPTFPDKRGNALGDAVRIEAEALPEFVGRALRHIAVVHGKNPDS